MRIILDLFIKYISTIMNITSKCVFNADFNLFIFICLCLIVYANEKETENSLHCYCYLTIVTKL